MSSSCSCQLRECCIGIHRIARRQGARSTRYPFDKSITDTFATSFMSMTSEVDGKRLPVKPITSAADDAQSWINLLPVLGPNVTDAEIGGLEFEHHAGADGSPTPTRRSALD